MIPTFLHRGQENWENTFGAAAGLWSRSRILKLRRVGVVFWGVLDSKSGVGIVFSSALDVKDIF